MMKRKHLGELIGVLFALSFHTKVFLVDSCEDTLTYFKCLFIENDTGFEHYVYLPEKLATNKKIIQALENGEQIEVILNHWFLEDELKNHHYVIAFVDAIPDSVCNFYKMIDLW